MYVHSIFPYRFAVFFMFFGAGGDGGGAGGGGVWTTKMLRWRR